jgi:hypothetical protein
LFIYAKDLFVEAISPSLEDCHAVPNSRWPFFEYPIIFWTPRGSLTAMAAAHPDRGGIPHNTAAGMVRTLPARHDCPVD